MKNGYQPKENPDNVEKDNPPNASTAVTMSSEELKESIEHVISNWKCYWINLPDTQKLMIRELEQVLKG